MTEEQRAKHRVAKKKYKAKVRRFSVDFYPTEYDLLAQIEKQPNKQGYIKELIRKDIQKGCNCERNAKAD